jgi:hypothetical protein
MRNLRRLQRICRTMAMRETLAKISGTVAWFGLGLRRRLWSLTGWGAVLDKTEG